MTLILPDDTIYVSFRGTDSTIVGWKEDFNMSFKSHIASQLSAKNYLEEVAKKYKFRKIRVGGHSKGGNIAIYASTFVDNNIKDRIMNVYNNDGPGFCEDIIESSEYKEILPKVHTYIPQSSIIGRLMNHKEDFTVVESTQKGIMQHDLYSWQVLGTSFVSLEELTNSSEFIDGTITEWLQHVEPKKREEVINIIFEILSATEAQTTKEFKSNWLENTKTITRLYKNLDSETREMILKTISLLFKSAKDVALKNFNKNI